MRLKILSYGVVASHPSVTHLGSLTEATAISDFDVFAFAPDTLGAHLMAGANQQGATRFTLSSSPGHFVSESIRRRRREISELLETKGGVVICMLQPNDLHFHAINDIGRAIDFGKYGLLEHLEDMHHQQLPLNIIEPGEGSDVRVMRGESGCGHEYLQTLAGHFRFTAHFDLTLEQGRRMGIVLATNSVNKPVAIELRIGSGLLCFLPPPHDVPGEQVAAALFNTARSFLSGFAEIPEPDWCTIIEVPGASRNDPEIDRLTDEREKLTHQIERLARSRRELVAFKKLLFGTGKAVLEPTVRAAFRLIGFTVREPEEYDGDWDVFLTDPDGQSGICEIEGSEGSVDVKKYRQLLDYIDAEGVDGRRHKGILVGNGFRLHPLIAPERENQFTQHVLNGASLHQFCLIPATELFKAVCAVLENDDEGLKTSIRESVLRVVGVWTFGR